jgi:hypothetical protein
MQATGISLSGKLVFEGPSTEAGVTFEAHPSKAAHALRDVPDLLVTHNHHGLWHHLRGSLVACLMSHVKDHTI